MSGGSGQSRLYGDEKVVTCGPQMRRRVQRQVVLEPWFWYADPEERLPGEFGKIDNVRLVDVTLAPGEYPDEQ